MSDKYHDGVMEGSEPETSKPNADGGPSGPSGPAPPQPAHKMSALDELHRGGAAKAYALALGKPSDEGAEKLVDRILHKVMPRLRTMTNKFYWIPWGIMWPITEALYWLSIASHRLWHVADRTVYHCEKRRKITQR